MTFSGHDDRTINIVLGLLLLLLYLRCVALMTSVTTGEGHCASLRLVAVFSPWSCPLRGTNWCAWRSSTGSSMKYISAQVLCFLFIYWNNWRYVDFYWQCASLWINNIVSNYGNAPCGLRRCKNGPDPFPGQMSYKATKPGLAVCHILACFFIIVLLFIRATFYVLLVFIVCVLSFGCSS